MTGEPHDEPTGLFDMEAYSMIARQLAVGLRPPGYRLATQQSVEHGAYAHAKLAARIGLAILSARESAK